MKTTALILALVTTAVSPALAQDSVQPARDDIEAAAEAAADAVEAAAADTEANLDAMADAMEEWAEADEYLGPDDPYPIESADLLIRGADYSAESYLAREEGEVGYRIAVEADGTATGCEVTSSSGIATLDDATCPTLMSREPTFDPGLDENGAPVAGSYYGTAYWQLGEPMPTDAVVRVSYLIDTQGEVESCDILEFRGDLPADTTPEKICERPPLNRGEVFRDERGIPVRKRIIFEVQLSTEDVAE